MARWQFNQLNTPFNICCAGIHITTLGIAIHMKCKKDLLKQPCPILENKFLYTKTLDWKIGKMSIRCRTCAEMIFNPNAKNIFEDEHEILENIETLTGIRVRLHELQ